LKQRDFHVRLRVAGTFPQDFRRNRLFIRRDNLRLIVISRAVTNEEPVARAHAQNFRDVLGVAACDNNLLVGNVRWGDKKFRHGFAATFQ
jgi:hypothetical protein